MNDHVHPLFQEILNTAVELLPTKESRAISKAERTTERELDRLDKAKLDEATPEREEIVRSGDNVYVKIGGNNE